MEYSAIVWACLSKSPWVVVLQRQGPTTSVALAFGRASARRGALIVTPLRLGDVYPERHSVAAPHIRVPLPAPVPSTPKPRNEPGVPALRSAEKHSIPNRIREMAAKRGMLALDAQVRHTASCARPWSSKTVRATHLPVWGSYSCMASVPGYVNRQPVALEGKIQREI